jgi:hypothetical protein
VSGLTSEQLVLFAALDERPTYHSGGRILAFEYAERRTRRRRKGGRSTQDVALRLEELAARARAQDRQLQKLGII